MRVLSNAVVVRALGQVQLGARCRSGAAWCGGAEAWRSLRAVPARGYVDNVWLLADDLPQGFLGLLYLRTTINGALRR